MCLKMLTQILDITSGDSQNAGPLKRPVVTSTAAPIFMRNIIAGDMRFYGTGKWSSRCQMLDVEFPEWAAFFNRMKAIGILQQLAAAMDKYDGVIVPHFDLVFRSFASCKPTDVKIVIVGQDPYPGSCNGYLEKKLRNDAVASGKYYGLRDIDKDEPIAHAIGLPFAVPFILEGKLPSSLQRIREAVRECGYAFETPCDLSGWSEQGVFLINACPVLMEGISSRNPNPWTAFITNVLQYLTELIEHPVFLLWGKSAQYFEEPIIKKKNTAFIIKTTHPSIRAAKAGGRQVSFMESKCFKLVNDFFNELNQLGVGKHVELIRW